MKKIVYLGTVATLAPMLAFAATADSILGVIGGILAKLIPLLITVAVVYFIWGVIQFTVSTDEEAKSGATKKIIQGLIGLFVIIAFWGIIRVVTQTFGVGPEQLNEGAIPCIPNRAAGVTCP